MTDRVSSVDLERLAKIGVVFVPFMTGTAIAVGVIYDVGWFYGVGPGFYSLFSFSEHAVFSLQAFPVALVYITAIFFGVLAWKVRPKPHYITLGVLGTGFASIAGFIYDQNYWAALAALAAVLCVLYILASVRSMGLLYKLLGVVTRDVHSYLLVRI